MSWPAGGLAGRAGTQITKNEENAGSYRDSAHFEVSKMAGTKTRSDAKSGRRGGTKTRSDAKSGRRGRRQRPETSEILYYILVTCHFFFIIIIPRRALVGRGGSPASVVHLAIVSAGCGRCARRVRATTSRHWRSTCLRGSCDLRLWAGTHSCGRARRRDLGGAFDSISAMWRSCI